MNGTSPSPSQSHIPPPHMDHSTTHARPQASASVPPQTNVHAPSQTPPAPPTGVVGNLMHKSDLNWYCQKLGIPLPVYETAVEGCTQAVRFRSTVFVGDKIFTSANTFANRKSAEQDAAKLALDHLQTEDEAKSTYLRVYLRKLVCQDKARCKMILKEFTDIIKMECAYETVLVEALPPAFVSFFTLNGTTYKGETGKNKKEAEQLAALAVILSLLDDPTYASAISKVIKSKFNACAAFNEVKDIANTGDCSVTGNKFKSITFNSDVMPLNQQALLINSLPQTETQGIHGVSDDKQDGTDLLTEALTVSRLSHVNLPLFSEPQHEIRLSEAAQPSSQQISVPVEKQGGRRVLDDKQGGADLPSEAVTGKRCSYVVLPSPLVSEPQHEMKSSEAGLAASQQIGVLVESVPTPALNLASDSISSRKRRKNKKMADKRKAKKRMRAENKSLAS